MSTIIKNTLDADLHQLICSSIALRWRSNGPGPQLATEWFPYSGALSYTDGHLSYDTYEPIPHELEAHFDAGRVGYDAERCEADQRAVAGTGECDPEQLQQS